MIRLTCVAAFLTAAVSTARLTAAPVVITIDNRATQVAAFIGFGVPWDPYEYAPSPEAWRLTMKRVDFLKPAFIRVMSSAGDYCLGFSADQKPDYIWTHDDKTLRERLGTLLWILDYAQSRNIPVLLGEWAPPAKLGDGATAVRIGTPDNPRWAVIIADFVRWLRVTRGYTVVRMYNMMNEPNGDWMWPDGKVDYEAWAAGIRNLRREFDARGLAKLPIVGPDNAWGWEWIDRVAKSMPECIGGWEMHWYATDREVLEGRVEELLTRKRSIVLANDPKARTKPFFMGEVGLVDGKTNGDQQPRVKQFDYGVIMADLAAQIARSGWQGAVAWDLDDAMHSANGHAVPPNDKTLKVWGFWNTQGTAMGHPADEGIRPWFATWSLMTRLFPRGARILKTGDTAVPGLRVLASVPQQGTGFTAMLVNNSDEQRTVVLRVPGAGTKNLYQYRYFENERPTDADGFPVASGPAASADLGDGITVPLPSRGVVFLSTTLVR